MLASAAAMLVAGLRWERGTPTEKCIWSERGKSRRMHGGGGGRRRARYHSPAAAGLMLSCFLSCMKYPRDEELKEPSGDCTSKCVVLA